MGAARLSHTEAGSPASCSSSLDMQLVEVAPSVEARAVRAAEEGFAMSGGGAMFLVAHDWWKAWKAHAHYDHISDSGATAALPMEAANPQHPGPIANSALLKSASTDLRLALRENHDYKVVCPETWEMLHAAYGGGPEIRRKVVCKNGSREPVIEVYPMPIKVLANVGEVQHRMDLLLSCEATIQELKTLACEDLKLDPEDVSVWDYYHDSKYRCLDNKLEQTLEDASILEEQPILLEVRSLMRSRGSDSSSSETNVTSPVADVASSLAPMTLATAGSGSSLRLSNGFSDTITASPGAERGLAGLGNLGNTCFMNSSLQCLSHTPPLVSFFLANLYRDDINQDNPLGQGGALAEAFGALLHLLWQGNTGSVSPRAFKYSLAQFAPQFSGYSQQDSQELLAFLLDGLHEDLNRIKDKPYVEDKDSNGRPDEELAAEAWHNYRLRNDSVVVDHFQGLFKSCLVCPGCGHSSVKFDPFMYLSLPLPTANKRQLSVTLVATDGSAPPTQYSVLVPKSGTVADLRAAIATAALLDTGTEEVVVAEVSFHRIRHLLPDDHDLHRLSSTQLYPLLAYRRPIPAPGAVMREVTVFHRRCTAFGRDLFAAPLLLWLPPSEGANGEEELEAALTAALRPLRSKGRRRGDSTDSVSMGSRSSASAMGLDSAGPAAAPSSSEAANAGTVADTAATLPMDEDGSCRSDVSSGTKPSSSGQPFDMWAASNRATPGSPTPPSPSSRRRKRGNSGAAYTLHPANAYGEVKAVGSWVGGSSTWSDDAVEYYVIEWESDGGGMYDAALLENPRIDESVEAVQAESERPASLASCLDCFLQHEKLDPQDSWYCPRCKDHVQADKKLDLWSLPEVLVVHLKRFSYTSRLRDKLTTPVDFPLEGLDLSAHLLTGQPVPPVYDLFAVSNHMGGLGGGHYTAYAKQPGTEQWYCFDDSRVSEVPADQVVSPNAYVLFYHRRQEAADRSNALTQVLRAEEAAKDGV